MDLAKSKCVACEGGVAPLGESEIKEYLAQVPGWALVGNKIQKVFKFQEFVAAIKFVDRVAELAEAEGHHPDIEIHYNQVTLTLWTHSIGGLHQNDFILAAKIDELPLPR